MAENDKLESNLHRLGRIEAVSLLVLLGVAMPLKYLANQPLAVTIVGGLHGFLWLAYLALLAYCWRKLSWPYSTVFAGGVASVLPFGPWWFESWARKRGGPKANRDAQTKLK